MLTDKNIVSFLKCNGVFQMTTNSKNSFILIFDYYFQSSLARVHIHVLVAIPFTILSTSQLNHRRDAQSVDYERDNNQQFLLGDLKPHAHQCKSAPRKDFHLLQQLGKLSLSLINDEAECMEASPPNRDYLELLNSRLLFHFRLYFFV